MTRCLLVGLLRTAIAKLRDEISIGKTLSFSDVPILLVCLGGLIGLIFEMRAVENTVSVWPVVLLSSVAGAAASPLVYALLSMVGNREMWAGTVLAVVGIVTGALAGAIHLNHVYIRHTTEQAVQVLEKKHVARSTKTPEEWRLLVRIGAHEEWIQVDRSTWGATDQGSTVVLPVSEGLLGLRVIGCTHTCG